MMFKWLVRPRHSKTTIRRILAAYPSSREGDVMAVLDILPVAKLEVRDSNVGVTLPWGERVILPSRVYFPSPSEELVSSLTESQNIILASLFT